MLLGLSLLACSAVSPTPTPGQSSEPTPAASPYPPLPGDPLFPAPTGQPTQQTGGQAATQYPPPQYPAPQSPPTQAAPQATAVPTGAAPTPIPTSASGQAASPTSSPQPTSTTLPEGAYPPPSNQPTPYPGPGEQPTAEASPLPPAQNTPTASSPNLPPPTLTSEPALPTQTPAGGGLEASVTPVLTATVTATLQPTESIPEFRPTLPPDRFTTVTIWHSWEDVQVLEQAIQAFQSSRPNVSFTLRFVPFDDLEQRFKSEAYYGGGPTLVLGQSAWGAGLYQAGLVEDIAGYISPEFSNSLNASALGTVQVGPAVFGLPLGLHGQLLYRNQKLIAQAPSTFDEMLSLAAQATRAGNVGLYLDWGMAYAGGFYQGLGGRWLDAQAGPLFQQNNYQTALKWLDLMQRASSAGALIEFSETRDLTLFKQGKVGMFVETSSLRNNLADAIGAENLMIDPWPALDGGRLAGFVDSDVVFLNINAGQRQALEKEAGLQFMGLLMTAAVQQRLAELGNIPAVRSAEPRNRLTAQATAAFETGVPFPALWQGELRSRAWTELNAASQAVYEKRAEPLAALQAAYAAILNK